MAADLAMAGGIGQGLQSFADSYLKGMQMKQQNQLNQRFADIASQKEQAGLLGQGMQVNPQTQQVEYNPAQQGLISATHDIAANRAQPGSEESNAAYNQYKQRLENVQPGASQFLPEGKSAIWYEQNIEPHLANEEKLATEKQIAQQRSNATIQAAQIKEGGAAGAGGSGGNKQQNAELQKTIQLLESARGNPAASQAEKDLYAAQKANSLFNRYKDPNQMSNQETQLYATEIAKMASGGVPSIHELQGLNPATIPASLASIAQKFANNPEPANAGEFMKRYKAYSDGLADDARQVIEDKYGRIIESKKDALGDNNYKKLQDNYINRFKDKKGLLSQDNSNAHPQDSQAVQWAKSNPNDPRAAAILKANGM